MKEIGEVLARNVARLRAAGGISLGQLADRSGVAKATLFKVERGQTNATLETIAAIANALGVEVTSLLQEPATEALQIRRLGEGVDISDSISTGEVLGNVATGPVQVEIHHQVFRAGTSLVSPSHGEHAREHVLVRGGAIEVGPLGETGMLRAGDYATYPADRPHSWRPVGNKGAEVWIVHTFLRA